MNKMKDRINKKIKTKTKNTLSNQFKCLSDWLFISLQLLKHSQILSPGEMYGMATRRLNCNSDPMHRELGPNSLSPSSRTLAR